MGARATNARRGALLEGAKMVWLFSYMKASWRMALSRKLDPLTRQSISSSFSNSTPKRSCMHAELLSKDYCHRRRFPSISLLKQEWRLATYMPSGPRFPKNICCRQVGILENRQDHPTLQFDNLPSAIAGGQSIVFLLSAWQ